MNSFLKLALVFGFILPLTGCCFPVVGTGVIYNVPVVPCGGVVYHVRVNNYHPVFYRHRNVYYVPAHPVVNGVTYHVNS